MSDNKKKSRVRFRLASSTTIIVLDGKTKYERPVDLRVGTLAGHRCQYAFRRGAGVKA